jgi:hypothetical protein
VWNMVRSWRLAYIGGSLIIYVNYFVFSNINLLVSELITLILILVFFLLFSLIENSLVNYLDSRFIERIIIIVSEEIGRKDIG